MFVQRDDVRVTRFKKIQTSVEEVDESEVFVVARVCRALPGEVGVTSTVLRKMLERKSSEGTASRRGSPRRR